MDNFEMDKLFGHTSEEILPSDDFKKQVLEESTIALRKSYKFHRRLRISGLMLGIFLIICVSFISGRFSAPKSQEDFRVFTKSNSSSQIDELKHVVNVRKEKSFWQTKAMASLQPKYENCKNRISVLGLLENYKKFIKGNYHE